MNTDFDLYWERCIRELGAAAQDPKAVAHWCFYQTTPPPTGKAVPEACLDGSEHVRVNGPGIVAFCMKCGKLLDNH